MDGAVGDTFNAVVIDPVELESWNVSRMIYAHSKYKTTLSLVEYACIEIILHAIYYLR